MVEYFDKKIEKNFKAIEKELKSLQKKYENGKPIIEFTGDFFGIPIWDQKSYDLINGRYKANFILYAYKEVSKSNKVEIPKYFYETSYSFYYGISLERLPNYEDLILTEFKRPISEFILEKLKLKQIGLTKHCPYSINYFSFLINIPIVNPETSDINYDSEIKVLRYIIEQLNRVRMSEDKQLQIFEGVILTKKISDFYTQILIDTFTKRLNSIDAKEFRYYTIQSDEKNNYKSRILNLPDNFSPDLKDFKPNNKGLTTPAMALLLYFLRQKKYIIEYNDVSLAKMLHFLTGYTFESAKTNGFKNKNKILKNKKNLNDLRQILNILLESVEKEIDNITY